ncbi:MAG: hypothetical protein ACI4LP_07085 [Anaerovoracaceae bacterium]
MENNKDYEKRLGRRLREAYLKDYEGPAMSREDFHRLIEAAEKKKNHKKAMIGLAAACVAICLVCGGFIAGMSMRESASAGKDDETKTVQQGGSVVIGSGVSENDQNVGVSTKTYTDIEDIPEDLREQIHFLDSDEFELEKVKVMCTNNKQHYILFYSNRVNRENQIEITEQSNILAGQSQKIILPEAEAKYSVENVEVFIEQTKKGDVYTFQSDNVIFYVSIKGQHQIKIEALVKDLIGN